MAAQDWSIVLEERLPFTSTILCDLIDANLLIPRSDCKMVRLGREGKVGDAVVRRGLQRYVLGKVTESIGLTRRGCGSE